MKRLATTMAAAVLMAHGTLSASPAPATSAAPKARTLQFRSADRAPAVQSARKASAECRGTPTQMCVCYKLNCKKGALPPTPPPSRPLRKAPSGDHEAIARMRGALT